MDEETKPTEPTKRVRYNSLPRLVRIHQSLLNVERLGMLEGITDDRWQKSLETLKKVVQERRK